MKEQPLVTSSTRANAPFLPASRSLPLRRDTSPQGRGHSSRRASKPSTRPATTMFVASTTATGLNTTNRKHASSVSTTSTHVVLLSVVRALLLDQPPCNRQATVLTRIHQCCVPVLHASSHTTPQVITTRTISAQERHSSSKTPHTHAVLLSAVVHALLVDQPLCHRQLTPPTRNQQCRISTLQVATDHTTCLRIKTDCNVHNSPQERHHSSKTPPTHIVLLRAVVRTLLLDQPLCHRQVAILTCK